MRHTLPALLFALIATPAFAQSVARNGDFNVIDQIDDWAVAEIPELSAEWNALDVDNDLESGSAMIGNLHANASNSVIITQCIRVQGGAMYAYGG